MPEMTDTTPKPPAAPEGQPIGGGNCEHNFPPNACPICRAKPPSGAADVDIEAIAEDFIVKNFNEPCTRTALGESLCALMASVVSSANRKSDGLVKMYGVDYAAMAQRVQSAERERDAWQAAAEARQTTAESWRKASADLEGELDRVNGDLAEARERDEDLTVELTAAWVGERSYCNSCGRHPTVHAPGCLLAARAKPQTDEGADKGGHIE